MHPRAAPAAASAVAVSAVTVGLLAGCASGPALSTTAGQAGSASNVITVSNTACGSGWRTPHPGLQTLQIRNVSSGAVEVSLINSGTSATYARVEGIGPKTTRAMPVDLGSGNFAFQCDGNNYSQRIGQTYKIAGHARDGVATLPVSPTQMFPVTSQAREYVSQGLTTVVHQVTALDAAIRAGDVARAKTLWLPAHLSWTRLGSAYGMFADYDDEINGIPNGLPGGVHDPGFTGFYRLEYGLWHGQSAARLTPLANELVKDATGLRTGWPGLAMTPALTVSDLALRTHEILENATRFQLSGQDNFGGGTTMATMAAAIDATTAQLKILHPLLVGRLQDLPALYSSLDRLRSLVDAAKTSHGWTPSAKITTAQRVELDAASGQTLELLAQIPPMFETKAIP
jgi:iron uptake system component EfeO